MGKTYSPLDKELSSTELKMTAIANKMDIDISYLYRLRVNPKNISALQLGAMAEATGIDFDVLYGIVKKFNSKVDKKAT